MSTGGVYVCVYMYGASPFDSTGLQRSVEEERQLIRQLLPAAMQPGVPIGPEGLSWACGHAAWYAKRPGQAGGGEEGSSSQSVHTCEGVKTE